MKKAVLVILICVLCFHCIACTPNLDKTKNEPIKEAPKVETEVFIPTDTAEHEENENTDISIDESYINDFVYYFQKRFNKTIDFRPGSESNTYNIYYDEINIGEATVYSTNEVFNFGYYLGSNFEQNETFANYFVETNIAVACHFDEKSARLMLHNNLMLINQALVNHQAASKQFGKYFCTCALSYQGNSLTEFFQTIKSPISMVKETYKMDRDTDHLHINEFIENINSNNYSLQTVNNIGFDCNIPKPGCDSLDLARTFDEYFETFFGDKYEIKTYIDLEYAIAIDQTPVGFLYIDNDKSALTARLIVFKSVDPDLLACLIETFTSVFGVDWNVQIIYEEGLKKIIEQQIDETYVFHNYGGMDYRCLASSKDDIYVFWASYEY